MSDPLTIIAVALIAAGILTLAGIAAYTWYHPYPGEHTAAVRSLHSTYGAETWTPQRLGQLAPPVDPWADPHRPLAPHSHAATDRHPSTDCRIPPYVLAHLDLERGRRLAQVRARLGRLGDTAVMDPIVDDQTWPGAVA